MTLRVKQRQLWDSNNTNTLNDELLQIHTNTDHIKASVLVFGDLPTAGNVDGDLRLVKDDKALYQWDATSSNWVKISSASDDQALGTSYFREIHNTTDGQNDIFIKNPHPFNRDKLLVFVDGELKNIDYDYIFSDSKTLVFNNPFTESQVVTLYLPASTQAIRVKTDSVYEYDALQNIRKMTMLGDVNRVTMYDYDSDQNIIWEQVTDLISGEKRTRTYEYDNNNNVIGVNDEGVDVLYIHKISPMALDYYSGVANHKVSCVYDDNGRLVQEFYTGDIRKRCEYFYNISNLIDTKITYEKDKTITEHFIYDTNKRLLEREVTVLRMGATT